MAAVTDPFTPGEFSWTADIKWDARGVEAFREWLARQEQRPRFPGPGNRHERRKRAKKARS